MLLGIKSKKKVFKRHLTVAIMAGVILYLFWLSRPEWSPEMRLWRAFGDSSFVLLWLTLILGPAAKLWKKLIRLISWRREFGVWFTVLGVLHGYLVLDGWARWNVWRLLGFKYVSQTEMYIRSEPGFGLANLMGLVTLIFAIALSATSFDKAVSFLGISSWKWLHTFAYVIYYIIILHASYYLFIHYTPSSIKASAPDPNWFRFYFLTIALSVPVAQTCAFIKTVRQNRKFGKP